MLVGVCVDLEVIAHVHIPHAATKVPAALFAIFVEFASFADFVQFLVVVFDGVAVKLVIPSVVHQFVGVVVEVVRFVRRGGHCFVLSLFLTRLLCHNTQPGIARMMYLYIIYTFRRSSNSCVDIVKALDFLCRVCYNFFDQPRLNSPGSPELLDVVNFL